MVPPPSTNRSSSSNEVRSSCRVPKYIAPSARFIMRPDWNPECTPGQAGCMYSPAQVADRTGFSLDTLRYYERIGLLDGIARTPGGRRSFTDDDLGWLEVLRCLRDTGMPIAQMLRYAELCRTG